MRQPASGSGAIPDEATRALSLIAALHYSHRDFEIVQTCFNVTYNARRQRVLTGRSPDMVLRERLAAKPELANPHAKPPDPRTLARALRVVADAKKVTLQDS